MHSILIGPACSNVKFHVVAINSLWVQIFSVFFYFHWRLNHVFHDVEITVFLVYVQVLPFGFDTQLWLTRTTNFGYTLLVQTCVMPKSATCHQDGYSKDHTLGIWYRLVVVPFMFHH